jgi:hypothetical protein
MGKQNVDYKRSCSPAEYVSYIFNIVAAIGTVLAVVVALFKESISKIIWRPKIVPSLSNSEDGFDEKIIEDQQTPEALNYSSNVSFVNRGSSDAIQCELHVSKVMYAKNATHKFKEVRTKTANNIVLWGREKNVTIDIPVERKKETELFRIMPQNQMTTPDNNNRDESSYIIIHGFSLDPKNRSKGIWQIDYYLKYKLGNSVGFTVTISWDGSWKSRKSEMKDCLTIKLEKK